MIKGRIQNLGNRWKLLGAIALVQLVFWIAVNPTLIQPPRSGEARPYEIVSHELIEFDGDTRHELKINEKSMIFGPDWEASLFPAGRYTFVTEFALPEVPEAGIALLDNSLADNSRFYFNGALLSAKGSMDAEEPTYHGLIRRIELVPPSMLVEGTNRIERDILLDHTVEGTMPPPILMDYVAAQQAYAWPAFLLHEGKFISIVVGFLLSCLILVAWIRAEKKALLGWLWLLCTSWAFSNLLRMWVDIPIHGADRAFLMAASTILLSMCWPLFVDEWSGSPNRVFKTVVAVAGLGGILVTGWLMLVIGHHATYQAHTLILEYLGIGLVLAMVVRLVWHFISHSDESRYWEAALLIMLGVLTGWFVLSALLYGADTPHLRLGQPLFLIAFTVAFFARNFRLFQSSAQLNALLQSQLTEREGELAVAHEREKVLVREQAYGEERQRIMRDMHDGLGSSLMSMLLAARRGKAEPEKVAEGLQQVIDEMRLLIDSMDNVGESLATALATFRERVQSRVETAGFRFEWNQEKELSNPDLGPRQILQIFRIMQEAVTNALKHSGGSLIAVSVGSARESDALEITVADNGNGIETTRVSGHGLDNMAARARSIGATVKIAKLSGGGTSAVLTLPEPGAN